MQLNEAISNESELTYSRILYYLKRIYEYNDGRKERYAFTSLFPLAFRWIRETVILSGRISILKANSNNILSIRYVYILRIIF